MFTFIPFTLLSIFLIAFVVDLSNPGVHIDRLIRTIIPDPYNTIIVKKVMRELNFISVSKKLSGPLGMVALFIFTTRLFGVLQTSFRIIFGGRPDSFLKGKGKEILFTLLFSIMQAILFFSFIFTFVIRIKPVQALTKMFGKVYTIGFFTILDMFFTFAMFSVLYYFMTPVRKHKKILFTTTALAVVVWHVGRAVFKHYAMYLAKITTFFGTYGVFIAFLFWLYFSVFVFITTAELQSILIGQANREQSPNSSRNRWKLLKERKGR